MFELSGMGGVLRGIGLLYWLLAFGAVALALRYGKGVRGKVIWTVVAIVVFGYLPGEAMVEQHRRNVYEKEAWAYFKKLCDEKSGEKIYKTYTGVKSVLVLTPLPSASDRDNFNQFWYGDPYSGAATSRRSEAAALRLVTDWKHRSGIGSQKGLSFVEMKNNSVEGYTRIYRPVSNNQDSVKEQTLQPVSRFGVRWEDISTPQDRNYWVAGSRFRVIDLKDNSVVAERIGFLIEAGFGSTAGQRRPWSNALGIGPNGRSCPDAHDATDQWFITTVFKQDSEK